MSGTDEHINLDTDRLQRCGFPEVVYAAGKTTEQTVAAARGLFAAHGLVLVTRANSEALAALADAIPGGERFDVSGCYAVNVPEPVAGPVAVISAGTSDAYVVEECAAVLRMRGVEAWVMGDCGVAGLHRLTNRLDDIRSCKVAVAIAGMDASMPTVLTGLVDIPVIAVPTSVGYGVAAGGRAALDSLLASCAAGMTVVNVDNGFGAGYASAGIALAIARAEAAAR